MNQIPIVRRLLARRLWRPLSQAVSFLQRQLWCGFDWLFTKRNLENACLWLLSPLARLHLRLCRNAGQAHAPRLFRHSSLAYDLVAVVEVLLAPLARWHAAACKRMKDETDLQLRGEDKPRNRNGEHRREDHEQS